MNGLVQGVLEQESIWLEGVSTYSMPSFQSGPLSSNPITSLKQPERDVLANIIATMATFVAVAPLILDG